MRGSRIHTIFLVIGILCTTVCRAGNTYTEVIQDLYAARELTLSPDNKVGTTDSVIYTCSGGTKAKIGIEEINPVGYRKIAINLPERYDQVVTSELEDLTGFVITCVGTVGYLNTKVYLSTDGGSTWGEELTTPDMTIASKVVTVTVPKGNYCIKVKNNESAKSFSILQIEYKFEHCNCFRYESGE